MRKAVHLHLSRRESQIIDALYTLGEASVQEVRSHLGDPVSYDSVRITLGVLEKKGYVTHRSDGVRFIYRPAVEAEEARQSILAHVLRTFFGGSAPKAMATLIDLSEGSLSPDELEEISRRIEQAAQKAEE